MKISGAVIIRNGVKYGFPFIQSIKSILPLCDEILVAVGRSEDDTRKRIAELNEPKITIIDTVWDDAKRQGGQVLSEQTNIALSKCSGDWIFYIQSDEVLHEQDIQTIRNSLVKYNGDPKIDGLAFDYIHFYGSYYTIQKGRHWYAEEVRLIRNHAGILSYGDAQGFRKGGEKLRAAASGAKIYHYGWARPPEVMVEKIRSFHKLWHDDSWVEENCGNADIKAHFSDLGNLETFEDTHPAAMKDTVNTDSAVFIQECRKKYLAKRNIFGWFRDFVRSLPVGRYKSFNRIR